MPLRDHVSNACLRDILARSGSRHLVDTCTWLVVAHRHARTSSPSAERLNLCLSGKELLRMLHMSSFLSVFPVTCAMPVSTKGNISILQFPFPSVQFQTALQITLSELRLLLKTLSAFQEVVNVGQNPLPYFPFGNPAHSLNLDFFFLSTTVSRTRLDFSVLECT